MSRFSRALGVRYVNPGKLISKRDIKTSLTQPAIAPITFGEDPKEIERDIKDAFKDSFAERAQGYLYPEQFSQDPEEIYQNQHKIEPWISEPEENENAETFPETLGYHEYPDANNATLDYGFDNFQAPNEGDLMPDSEPSHQSYEDISQGKPLTAANVGLRTKAVNDMPVDGVLPTSANETKGNFKINQGAVTGEGEYKISPEKVEVNVKLHIKTPTTPIQGFKPGMCLGSCPTEASGNTSAGVTSPENPVAPATPAPSATPAPVACIGWC